MPKDIQESSVKVQLLHYAAYWKWFIISVFVTISVAYIYIYSSIPFYNSSSSILIKDESNSALSELAAFDDLGLTGAGLSESAFENELEIIRSRRIIGEVITSLKLNVSYFRNDRFKKIELFENKPVEVKVLSEEESIKTILFDLKLVDEASCQISFDGSGNFVNYDFGERISFKGNEFILFPRFDYLSIKNEAPSKTYTIQVSSIENTINALRSSIGVEQVSEKSSIIKLSLIGSNFKKSEVILNRLVEVFNNDAINDRTAVTKSTAIFIKTRLAIIQSELDSVEQQKEVFNRTNKLVDIQEEGKLFLKDVDKVVEKNFEIETKLDLLNSLSEYLSSGNEDDLIPINIGSDIGLSNTAVENYNALILERNKLLNSSTNLNPVVIAVNQQISAIRSNLLENLTTLKTALEIENREVQLRQATINNKLSNIPKIGRSSLVIERQRSIKEALYLYLSQKKEETAIALSVVTPKAKIVDYAYTSKSPISPKKRIILLLSILLGILIPLVVIYFKELFDTKIHSRSDVEMLLSNPPILGEIPEVKAKESSTIITNDRSVLSEAFRIIRTNLSYFLRVNEQTSEKVIFVTSTVKGEGKTFVAYNLALSLASTNKSVILLGADIRNPQIHRYLEGIKWTIGLAEYLHDYNVIESSIINELGTDKYNLNVILSGKVPPNPAELLLNGRFSQLIDTLSKSYDYIVVDTAPTLLVTDTLLLTQKSNVTVYVCRAEYTDKKLLQYPSELIDEGKLKNVGFILNSITRTNFGYGSKYGYGYGEEELSYFERLKKRWEEF
ncbi:capsular exopolysaccharide synthesis family protein [Dokdonia sp. Hel_I_63]|uniref:GumC family protein n=1 Tax=Dokdonia sp. Hel_I_63 TaxID=1249996 RepID=UPI00119AE8A6|nr:polysaccharide biosynthesis tyrosine autokinase [Dokdonia sp. Hel_I_63]TVZ23013.1 capsular exopolysaccharide synthesis family protein [Dokdonia sp. Hel_I_63]